MSRYRKELYPISIYHNRVEDNERMKELIVPQIEKNLKDIAPVPNGWLTTQCKTSFDSDDINGSIFYNGEHSEEIRGQYMNVLKSFFDKDWEVDIPSMWFNYYTNGEYQEGHTHLGTYNAPLHFACVHFLSLDPERHSPLAFTDPLTVIRTPMFEMDSSNYGEKYYVNAKEGDFVMFPSYLEHEVKAGPPTPDYPRITVSFNIRMLRYGDE